VQFEAYKFTNPKQITSQEVTKKFISPSSNSFIATNCQHIMDTINTQNTMMDLWWGINSQHDSNVNLQNLALSKLKLINKCEQNE
jgi:hypothetical protein